eukprot:CAMPEP_0197438344 /NCGR_PEP_ID=MMETSP1175-20131217/5372_1 /TAXON_ID=1003142 /ORGANISM="Triceratium dubium, Strain CCMP147" /LENGTH=408 /DNA_ID=CAMNT_0042968057 /DNA_START=73 /DNA_END=1295 /DNA_ORIENTATION=+
MAAPVKVKDRKYESVVFSAYVVPTIPILSGAVGDPDGAGYVAGKYVGLDDPKKDIKARMRLVAAAADQVYNLAAETRDDPSILHIFMVPEFFFRGKTGAYESSPDQDLTQYGGTIAREIGDQPKFANWMFVFGTYLHSDIGAADSVKRKKAEAREDLIQALVRAYEASPDDDTREFVFSLLTQATEFAQSRPLTVVRNSCFIYKQQSSSWPMGLFIDKRFISHEDFVISYYSPTAYTEMNVAYPYVDESSGELKSEATDAKSIFSMDGITFAVEICLDHRRGRLRMAREENEQSRVPVDIQLVPSCGMQLQQPSIIAKTGGFVFNCDGQYATRDTKASPDDHTSVFKGSKDGKGHTQLTTVKAEASAPEQHATLEIPKDARVITAPFSVPSDVNVDQIEACGAGEVHL